MAKVSEKIFKAGTVDEIRSLAFLRPRPRPACGLHALPDLLRSIVRSREGRNWMALYTIVHIYIHILSLAGADG
jgi:hypothetical protein